MTAALALGVVVGALVGVGAAFLASEAISDAYKAGVAPSGVVTMSASSVLAFAFSTACLLNLI